TNKSREVARCEPDRRPAAGSVPARSSTVLVTAYAYNSNGDIAEVFDPRNIIQLRQYDELHNLTQIVDDFTDGTPTANSNKTTNYLYNGSNELYAVEAVLPASAVQITKWVYGV